MKPDSGCNGTGKVQTVEDLIVLVATNKEYRMPSDTVYRPIQAGSHSDTFDGFLQDHTGDNIADRNRRLCELTAAYWAWKNLEYDWLGLVQYRRVNTLPQAFHG